MSYSKLMEEIANVQDLQEQLEKELQQLPIILIIYLLLGQEPCVQFRILNKRKMKLVSKKLEVLSIRSLEEVNGGRVRGGGLAGIAISLSLWVNDNWDCIASSYREARK